MEKKKQMIFRVITGILTLGIMLLIFSFSAQNGEVSSGTSGRIVDWVIQKIFQPIFASNEGIMGWLEENLGFVVRKLAHFSIYTALGMSATGFFFTFEGLTKKRQAIFAILLGCVYAATDEFHQLFTAGRSRRNNRCIIRLRRSYFRNGLCYFGLVFSNKTKKESKK